MKKRGFTLVELLAVIVILAVIVLITIPVVLNIIEKAKKGAVKSTGYSIGEAANYYYAKKYYNNENIAGSILDVHELSFKGHVDFGYVMYDNSGKYAFIIYDNKYCAYKYADGEDVIVGDVRENICYVNEHPITISDLAIATTGSAEQIIGTTATITGNKVTVQKGSTTEEYEISSDGSIKKNNVSLSETQAIDAAYEEVVSAILSTPNAAVSLLNNNDLMSGIKTNTAGMNKMLDGFVDYFNIENHAQSILDDINDVQSRISNIVGGTAVIDQGIEVKAKLQSYMTSVSNVVNNVDIIVDNMDKIVENQAFTEAIFNLEDAYTKLSVSNAAAAIPKNANAFEAAVNCPTFIAQALENQAFRTSMYDNANITESIIQNNPSVITAMKSSTRYVSSTKYIKQGSFNNSNGTISGTMSDPLDYNGKAFMIKIYHATSTSNHHALVGKFIIGDYFKDLGAVSTSGYNINKFVSQVYSSMTNNPYNIINTTVEYFKI